MKNSFDGVMQKVESSSHCNKCSATIPIYKVSDLIMHDFIWLSHALNVIYVYILCKYHEICFENVCVCVSILCILDMYVCK